jgi:hypothetical protein
VRQELIDVANQAEELLRSRLTLLADLPHLFARRIEDPVLVRHLDQLGPLADHEDVALEQTSHAGILAAPGTAVKMVSSRPPTSARTDLFRWALRGSNPRPSPCKGDGNLQLILRENARYVPFGLLL